MVKYAVVTDQNQQPEPPPRKPNEDWAGCNVMGDVVVAVLMDGIPVLRAADGTYPKDNGAVAARLAVEEIIRFLRGRKNPFRPGLREAFRTANARIREDNRMELYEKTPPFWLATVGCALWADASAEEGLLAFLGDPLAFVITPERQVSLLTNDQLRHGHAHLFPTHKEASGYDVNIREHYDRYVRNVWDASCWCGATFRGWGALTGEETALQFLELVSVAVPPGTRAVLASDAFGALGRAWGEEYGVEPYQEVLLAALNLPPAGAVRELLCRTRAAEKEGDLRSDDATFVVVDF